ncbi:MAG: trehalose synthase [Polyangiaceae bacterium]|jgi:maltose alpha-D-glucosyltransferase/alpha-amylase|nr:trehalose synthase [Polyangiaceae bacterium]
MNEADWYKDAVIYELRVRSFYDSDGDGIGDLRGLIQKLDYLRDLGVSALWLLPLYPSPLKDDGYDIADYFAVHPAVGTLDDFRELLTEAHARGLRVITELVLNHTSDQHPWFERARRAPPGSPERDFYVWSDDPSKWSEARIIFQDYETSNWSWDPVAKQYFWHRFFSHQPDLNFDNPEVQTAMLEVVDFWFSLGVDGMRLDAVPYLYERAGTTCENLPETHAFLRNLRAHVDRTFTGRMLLAEANQWPEDAALYFGRGDECHMSFHFPIMPRLFMALRMEDSYAIGDILEQTPSIPESCQWAIFLRNHDELTLEMVTDEERDYMVERYASDRQTRINLGIRRRLAPLLENDRRRIEVMNLLLFSLPGTPVLYYGDEIGMGDNAYLGDRDGVRTPMQWSPDRNGGFSRANPQRLILPTITDPSYHFESVNVELQEQSPSSLLWWMKRTIALRKQHLAFGRGTLRMLAPENRKVLAFLREHEGATLLVVVNLSRHPQWVELELSEFAGVVPVELVGNGAFPAIESRPYRLTLGGHDGLWFSLSSELERQRRVSLTSPVALGAADHVGDWNELFLKDSKLEPVLSLYVPAQRWFRSKARSVAKAQIADALDLMGLINPSASLAGLWLAFVQVSFTEGEPETYVLPLSMVQASERPENALLGVRKAESSTTRYWLCDASLAPETALALHELSFRDERVSGRALALRGKRGGKGFIAAPDPIRPLGAEQSNTSFLFGQQLVGKLVRRVEAGSSLEVETLRALETATRRPNVPVLEARIDIETSGDVGTLWMSESYVQNEGDAWQLTIDHAQRFYEAVLTKRRGELPKELGLFDATDATLDVDYVPLASLLGKRTAELHAALYETSIGTEAAPKGFTALSSRAFYQSVRNLSGRAFDALKTVSLPEPASRLAKSLVQRKASLRQILDRALTQPLAGQRMRVHGDYHLGQVLYTGSDFYIIDFEGEPARTPVERRRLRSPLADIAGMLRSFHYAAFGVLAMPLPGAQIRPEDREQLEPWARAFYQAAAHHFLTSYLTATEGAPFRGGGPDQLRTLLEIQLVEKALYELLYELNNRPSWAELPLRGLLALMEEA